jgi:hypothetical protein
LRQAYDYWQNQPGNYLRPGTTTPRAPGGRGSPPHRGKGRRLARGRDEPSSSGQPGTASAHQRVPVTIQLPSLSSPKVGPPQQYHQRKRPSGRWWAAAYASRWRRPPADTPANGGSRRRLTPRNLTVTAGQRPTIHRSHQCRAPKTLPDFGHGRGGQLRGGRPQPMGGRPPV